MAGAEKVVEKVPGWVERALLPSLEARVRSVVKEEIGGLRRVMEARFEAIDRRFEAVDRRFDAVDQRFDAVDKRFEAMEARFDAVDARFGSMEKQLSVVQDLADLRARVSAIERRMP